MTPRGGRDAIDGVETLLRRQAGPEGAGPGRAGGRRGERGRAARSSRKALGVPASAVTLRSAGATARLKTFRVAGEAARSPRRSPH